MTKAEYIEYWKNTSGRDWETVQVLLNGRRFLHALFFTHLSFEKLIKAFWVKDNLEDTPPLIHNLVHLYDQTNLDLSTDETELLYSLNQYNIAGCYQDYKDKIYHRVTETYARKKIEACQKLRDILLQKLH